MLSERLRAETRVEHERVEAVFDITRANVTAAEVRGWVEAFYGFFRPYEAAVAATAPADVAAFFAPRRKVELLEADLRRMGHTAASVGELPRCSVLPDMSSDAGALGAIYVTEGSTLGGQVISRHLAGVADVPPLGFFQPYGDETGPMWRAFQGYMRERVPSGGHDEAVRSARDTFAALHDWLVANKPLRP